MSDFVTVEVISGVPVITYNPTPKMKLFAAYRAHPQYARLSDKGLLKKMGFRDTVLEQWRKICGEHFDAWLSEAVGQLMPGNLKVALEAIGIERALEGDFQFWKPLAIREKVISPDAATLNLIPSQLGNYDNLNDVDFDKARDALLSDLRGVGDEGANPMADAFEAGEPEGDSDGTGEVPEESLVLPSGLVPD